MLSRPINGYKKNFNSTFVLDGCTPEDVARAMIERGVQKQPFHIFDMDEAHRRIQHFKDLMPKVQIFYAMKANDYDMMMKLAISQGLGFDCATPGEIEKVLKLGVNPTSVIYAMPIKTAGEMEFARKAGVRHTTFDSPYELKKLKQYWPDASLLIRIRVESKSLYNLGEKFGCDFDTEATDLLDEAAGLGLRVSGVAFHVGSACFSPESYEIGLRNAHTLFEYEARAGRRMDILDFGGGFLSDRTDRIDEVADIINNTLEELFPDPSIQIIAEPGRYLCDSSATLYTNISNIRRIRKNKKIINQIHINDGIYGTLRCSEPWHTVEKFQWTSQKLEEELEEAILFGPSCDCDDRIMKDHDIRLPSCSPFDWLVFKTQGAYTTNFASYFSCLAIPLIRSVVSSELWNDIKDKAVFTTSDFLIDPDISTPLPSTIPTLPVTTVTMQKPSQYHTKTPSLII